ncbi:unnamed protein product [Choristocarpus tenellus]
MGGFLHGLLRAGIRNWYNSWISGQGQRQVEGQGSGRERERKPMELGNQRGNSSRSCPRRHRFDEGLNGHMGIIPCSPVLHFHLVLLTMQFAISNMVEQGQVRVLCKATVKALAGEAFWRSMSNLELDEGEEGHDQDTEKVACDRPKRWTTQTLDDGMGHHKGVTDSENLNRRQDENGRQGGSTITTTWKQGSQIRNSGEFFRRYHHHVTFRRLAPPTISVHSDTFPAGLRPSCLDVCGQMAVVGMQEGLVLLFDTSPWPSPPSPVPSPSSAPATSPIHAGSFWSPDGFTSTRPPQSGKEGRRRPLRVFGSIGRGIVHAVVLDHSKVIVGSRKRGTSLSSTTTHRPRLGSSNRQPTAPYLDAGFVVRYLHLFVSLKNGIFCTVELNAFCYAGNISTSIKQLERHIPRWRG